MQATPRPDTRPVPDARALGETLLAFAGVMAATWVIATVGRAPPLDAYVHPAIGLVFLWAAVELASRAPGGISHHGLALGGLLEPVAPAPEGALAALVDLARTARRGLVPAVREVGFALFVALAIFPPFALGFHLWHSPTRTFSFVAPSEPASYLLSQLVVTALPEEAFFRGYVQTRLGDRFVRTVRVLGTQVSLPALVLQALLFALIHLVADADPQRLAVFFPALLFGWLRARRGGIGAAVVMHAASNMLSDTLAHGWL